jgi:hypothetical protein
MQHLIVKIRKAIAEIEDERGVFQIKSLIAKDKEDIRWDLILSADWFSTNLLERTQYLSNQILKDFDSECMMHFSSIISFLPNETNDLLKSIKNIQNRYSQGAYLFGEQEYTLIESHSTYFKWIIPLNEREFAIAWR